MSDLELASAVYENYCAMWREAGAIAPSGSIFAVQQRPDMLLIRSNYARRIPHMILAPTLNGHVPSAWVAGMARELTVDPISLMVAIPPGAEDTPLIPALAAEGFLPAARPHVAMVAPLGDPAPDSRPGAISLASGEADLAEARDLLARVFGLPSLVFAFYTPPSIVHTYLLRQDGRALGAVCLCPFAGSAGIYSVGVLPSARGRGLARRLVRHALGEAAGMGYRRAVLSCERHLTGLYLPFGFRPCWDLSSYWLEAWWR